MAVVAAKFRGMSLNREHFEGWSVTLAPGEASGRTAAATGLRPQHKGRRRDYGLGPVHDGALAEARVSSATDEHAENTGTASSAQDGAVRPWPFSERNRSI